MNELAPSERRENVRRDAPDHLEELVISRCRRQQDTTPSTVHVSRERAVSAMSAASSSSVSGNSDLAVYSRGPQHELQHNQPMQSMICSEISPVPKLPLTPDNGSTSSHSSRLARRPQSPHPADISNSQHSLPSPASAGSIGMSGFTLSNNLRSSESAQELQKLIRDMQSEFQRLRWSKVKAEAREETLEHSLAVQRTQAQEAGARAEQLENDLAMAREDNLYKELNIDQHEMDERIKSLSAENARLKSELSECKITSGEQAGNAFQLERENRELQTELSIHRNIQQQEIDRHIESLTAEKDRLISNLFNNKVALGQLTKRIKQLENENKLLKVDTVQMQKALEVLLPKGGGAQQKESAGGKRRGSKSKEPLSSHLLPNRRP